MAYLCSGDIGRSIRGPLLRITDRNNQLTPVNFYYQNMNEVIKMTNGSKVVEASSNVPAQAELETNPKVKGDYTGYFYRSIQTLNQVVEELTAEIILLKQKNNGGN